MKKYILYILIFFLPQCVMGQKKAISQARDFVKSGSSLDNAEKLMTDLLKDSTNRSNEKYGSHFSKRNRNSMIRVTRNCI